MVYYCERCGFLFHRYGAVQKCPACEDQNIRLATPAEGARFNQQLEGKPLPKGEEV